MASRRPVNNKGFSLLELIITIFVVSVGILGTHSVVSYTLSAIGLSASRLTAAYLAQEGIEIVRNIRDTNWIEGGFVVWDSGLSEGSYEADYQSDDLVPCSFPCDFNSNLRLLQIEGGFYRYSATGIDTSFKRKIIITDAGLPDFLTVTVSVEWEHKGKLQQPVTVQENLYNWQQPS